VLLLFESEIEVLALSELKAGLVNMTEGADDFLGTDPLFTKTLKGETADGEQSIAYVDCLRLAPQAPDGWTVSPLRAAVLDVIVDQREVV
jgi:hypothetical protein